MPRSDTQFRPGQSGNPKGRPPKNRALTEILSVAGAKSLKVDGKSIAGRRLVAQLAWEMVTTGAITFPGSEGSRWVSTEDWLAAVKWLYGQIDGPPKLETSVEMSGSLEVTEGGLTDEERATRIAALLDRARARRARSASDREPE